MTDEVERLISEMRKSITIIRTTGNKFDIKMNASIIENIAESIVQELEYEKRNP